MRLYVDWNGDLDWLDTGEDVTADVQDVSWQRGRDVASQLTGRSTAGKLSARLKDATGKYASFNAASPLYGMLLPGRKVQLRDDSANPQWTGYLERIEPVPSIDGLQMATLTAFGPLGLPTKKVETAMLATVRTDQVIGSVLDAAAWPAGDRSLDVGLTTLGRWWCYDKGMIEASREAERAEAGFILEMKDGKIAFENRQHRLVTPHTVSQATFSDTAGGLSYSVIRQIDPLAFVFNRFLASARRHSVGSLAVLWTHPETGADSPKIERDGQSRIFVAVNTNGVNAWTTPVATTDFLANSQADGLGTNLTGSITVGVVKRAVTMAVTLTNTHPTLDAYVTFLQARGTPLAELDMAQVTAEDAPSQTAYGVREFPSPPEWLPDTEEAQDWALLNLSIFKDPIPFLEMTFPAHRDAAHLTQALNRDVGDRITLVAGTGALLGINGDFFIEAINQRVNLEGEHLVAFLLSDAEKYSDFWVLGISALGTQTRLSY